MMTGAILILAHTMLYAVYLLGDWSKHHDKDWVQWYSWAIGGVGAAFLVWGFAIDLSAARWRRRRRGDT
jgi:hypothetical protein